MPLGASPQDIRRRRRNCVFGWIGYHVAAVFEEHAARSAMPKPSPYEHDLDKNAANYAPLSPISLIARTAYTYPQQLAVVHGDRRYTWEETYARSRRLASALARAGVGPGDTVAVMAANTPEMVEAHFGVPMSGAVLNTLNTRLDADAIAFMLGHGEAKVLLTDTEFAPIVGAALQKLEQKPMVIDIVDPIGPGGAQTRRARLRSIPRRRRSRLRLAAARGRMVGDRAQLHVGHDRQSEGRRLPSSRRLPECAVQHHRLGHAAAFGLSVDVADVPLQRLVLCLDDGGQRRHQRLPAQGRGQADPRCDSRAPGHALLRRADRARDADQCAGGVEAGHRRTRSAAWSRRRRRRRR